MFYQKFFINCSFVSFSPSSVSILETLRQNQIFQVLGIEKKKEKIYEEVDLCCSIIFHYIWVSFSGLHLYLIGFRYISNVK